MPASALRHPCIGGELYAVPHGNVNSKLHHLRTYQGEGPRNETEDPQSERPPHLVRDGPKPIAYSCREFRLQREHFDLAYLSGVDFSSLSDAGRSATPLLELTSHGPRN